MSKELINEIESKIAWNDMNINETSISLRDVKRLLNELEEQAERVEELEEENRGLKKFYDYWSELYGKGLEVANWHMNGDLEPFDSFFDSAEEELESDNDE